MSLILRLIESRSWRVALALLASLAIHLATLAGLGLQEVEHIERGESLTLAARIAPLAPVAAPAADAVPARPKRKSKPVPEASAAAPPAPLPVEAVMPAETTAASGEAPVRAEPAAPAPVASGSSTEPPARAEPPIAFPERIELEFDLVKGFNEAPIGRVAHRFERDGARYVIESVSTVVGIAALFVTGRYVQESRGMLTPLGLQPDHFVVRRGRVERTESAAFHWESSRATLSAGGTNREWALQAGAQDQLSYLHQLSFLIADPTLRTVMVTNGRRFYSARVEILARETVATGLGPVSAVHVRGQLDGESRIDVWLAPEYGNLPVKVRIRDQRGEELEQVLTALKVK